MGGKPSKITKKVWSPLLVNVYYTQHSFVVKQVLLVMTSISKQKPIKALIMGKF